MTIKSFFAFVSLLRTQVFQRCITITIFVLNYAALSSCLVILDAGLQYGVEQSVAVQFRGSGFYIPKLRETLRVYCLTLTQDSNFLEKQHEFVEMQYFTYVFSCITRSLLTGSQSLFQIWLQKLLFRHKFSKIIHP